MIKTAEEFITMVKEQQRLLRIEYDRHRVASNRPMQDFISGQLGVLGWTLYCLEGERD